MGIKISAKPDWLPDWHDAAAYPSVNRQTPSAVWAWEFLRRNPEYRADFEFATRQPSIADEAAARWKLRTMADPSISWRSPPAKRSRVQFVRARTTIVHPYPPRAKSRSVVDLKPYEVAVVFDLRGPIEVQTNDAKAALIATRRAKVKDGTIDHVRKGASAQMDKMPIYLRTLDAIATLQSLPDARRALREFLYLTIDSRAAAARVIEDVKCAEYYRDSGYHTLLKREAGKLDPP